MKVVLFIFGLFVSVTVFSQQSHQGIRLFIYEITKTGKQLVPNAKVEVTINDSTKLLEADDYGKINILEVPLGEYIIKVKRKDCNAQEVKGVEVIENKIIYLSFELVCQSYIDALSKKEKKKLGLIN
ncbi:MAG: hypothetical protein ABI388_06310 [Bacteroidia bacterium]